MKKNNKKLTSILSLTDVAFILLLIYLTQIKSGAGEFTDNSLLKFKLPISSTSHPVMIIINNETICIKHPSIQVKTINYWDGNSNFEFTVDCQDMILESLGELYTKYGELKITLLINENTEYWAVVKLREILGI